MCSPNCLLVIIAIIFPPLPVWVKRGLCSADSLINIALCCLGFLPGLIHAWYIISVTPDDYELGHGYVAVPAQDVDVERHPGDGRVSYYVVSGPRVYVQQGRESRRARLTAPVPGLQSYGTTGPAQPSARPTQPYGGPSTGDIPPTYNEAIQGDNKLQRK